MIKILSRNLYTTDISINTKGGNALLFSLRQQYKHFKSVLCISLVFSLFVTPVVSAMEPVDAARLLQQATFGPEPSDVEKLKTMDAEAWLDEQLSLPPTLHRSYFPADAEFARTNHQRVHAWFQAALHADDQLRQRIAYALSQIFVVSQVNSVTHRKQEGLILYYDMLINGALGNYRDLMYDVTMSPIMGTYLTYAPNYKKDPNGSEEADENYARELMQLMSLGPYLLQQNGDYQTDNGQRIETYSQEQIKGFAKVFTGLCYEDRCDERFAEMITPMLPNYSAHDKTEKQLLSTVLPANPISIKADVDAALDDIFAHANIAPFVSKRLIQQLVTSNPIPEYIARVAAVFNNNGNGVKGDLAAVVKAILLDDEARSGHVSENAQSYGKLREPIIMMTHFYRTFEMYADGDAPAPYNIERGLDQAPLTAPSVFNFFEFDYAHPGLPENMVSPVFQINTEVQLLNHQNYWNSELRFGIPSNGRVTNLIDSAATREEGLNAYADFIDLMFTQGQMSAGLRKEVIDIVKVTRARDTLRDGTRNFRFHDKDAIGNMMIMLFLSPEFAIQR